MAALTPSRLRSERLAAQGVDVRGAGPGAVVERMLAVQAQDLAQARWAIGVRAHGTTRDDVLDAFDRAEIVRSWPMRGTLHAMRPDDLRWVLSLTGERTIRSLARRAAQLGIDDDVLRRARDSVVAGLTGGRSLLRDEVFACWSADGIDPAGGRGYHLLLRLALEGLVVWGPSARVGQGLVLLDEWAPATAPVPERDDALGRLVTGYLRGRGPATEADTAAWTKLPLGDVRRGLAVAGDAVEDLGGGLLALADRPSAGGIPSGHLLAGFDEYLLGYADRSAQLPVEHEDRVVPGGNGMFLPMAVVRGVVVGTWRRVERSSGVHVTVTPFGAPDPSAVRSLEAAADRYRRWLGAPVSFAVA